MIFAKSVFKDVLDIPSADLGVVRVWKKNFLFFKRTFWISFSFLMFEPLLYLLVIGHGLGYFVGYIEGVSYVRYFLPALLAISGMMISFFESSYGAFSRFKNTNSFSNLMMTPVNPEEIVLGEILWGASKGFVAVLGVTFVAILFGLIKTWLILPALLILALCCWIFSALGMLLTSYAKDTDIFIITQSVLILPLALICNTYFPVESLSKSLAAIAWLFPLTHVVEVLRSVILNQFTSDFWMSQLGLGVTVILIYAIILTNWSVARMKRKLYN